MIAICVSGIIGPDYKKIIDRIRKILPYPIYFGTWKGRDLPDVDNLQTFPEPNFHYHPMLETAQKPTCNIWNDLTKESGKIRRVIGRREQTRTSATQILGHYKLVESIPKKYKTIIRLRYDSILSSEVDFKKYIEMAENGKVIGFGNFKSEKVSPILKKPVSDITEYTHKSIPRCYYNIWDTMIIHPRENMENAWNLYEGKNLMGMEWGWYQVLCKQWNTTDYINVNGGVILQKLCTTPIEKLNNELA